MRNHRLILFCQHIFICLAALTTQYAQAQTPVLLRGGQGISSNMISHIVCDRDGVMWIATDNGVNRLDGAKNTIINNEQGASNVFVYTLQDSKGRSWLCGTDNIYLYDPNTEKPVAIQSYDASGNKISITIGMMIERKDGTVLACSTGHGVVKLVEKDGKMIFQQIDLLTMQPKISKNSLFFISDIVEDDYGALWACTEQGVVRCKDGKMQKIQCGDATKLRHYSFISTSKDGNVWCGNSAGGLWRINPKTLQVAEVPSLVNTPVISIVANRPHEILVGTNANGIINVNSHTLVTTQVPITVGNITDNRLNIHSLDDDKCGNLWIACYQKGVLVLPSQVQRFNYIGRNTATSANIGNGCVMSLGRDASGKIWVAGDSDGMYAVQGSASVHYAPSATMPRTVMTQYTDSKGRIWLGTWLQGLWVMNPATGVAAPVTMPVSDAAFSVFAITEDAEGHLWIGTQGEGLLSLDVESGKFTKVPGVMTGLDYSPTKNIVPNRWINGFSKGPGDILFLATCDGVGAIDMKTKDCLKMFKGKNRMFASTNVSTVCYTKDQRLWVGTDRGLYCVDMKTLNVRQFKQSDGLLGNVVQSIVDTGTGSLWISTNAGIAHLILKNQHIVSYSSFNGMYGNEFSRNAALMTPDGNLWFGGTEGVSYFNQKNVMKSAGKPMLAVTGLYVDGQRVTPSSESDGKPIITTSIMNADEIDVSYADNSFTLEFSTLNYIRNADVTYEYKIDNDEWRRLPMGINTISFSNQQPGTYKITIRAVLQDECSDERVITIHVRSPWYATWWACIVYLIILALIVYAVTMRIRQGHLNTINELKLRQQEEINDAKLQFFTNISHEIRTPMTLIISPLQRLINTDTDPDHQIAFRRMDRNAKRILQLVNQMLDMRKIEKGQMKLYFCETEMTSFIKMFVQGFQDLCDTKHITINYQCQLQSLKAWIDPMNFEKIIINLISNSFKYTPEGGTITVSLAADAGNYSIRVEDTGCGLNENEKDRVFDRFYQLQNVANRKGQALGGEKNAIQGTGIGLNLTRSLVELHHGTISCDNNGDGKPGCHFIVTMPLGCEHLQKDEIDEKPYEMPEPVAQAPAVTTTEKDTAKPKTRRRVFVVEDDIDISSYLKEELSRDFIVTVCGNGQEALTLLHSNQKCDLIISDVMMPVMDGLQMLRHIRQNTNLNSLPVVLLTAKVTDKDSIEGLQIGADAYITKPFNIEVLRTTVKNLIQRQAELKNIFEGKQNPTVEKKIQVVSPDEKLMQRIMKVINANIANPDLGNELITREVGISRVHLYRKLKELTNLSLRDYIRNIRLNEAARLLAEQKHSVAEIAARTGFENVSYFTVVFKQKYGVPPSQYFTKIAENKDVDDALEHEQ